MRFRVHLKFDVEFCVRKSLLILCKIAVRVEQTSTREGLMIESVTQQPDLLVNPWKPWYNRPSHTIGIIVCCAKHSHTNVNGLLPRIGLETMKRPTARITI